jgi:hypothetical protein
MQGGSPLRYVTQEMRELFLALPYRQRIAAYRMGLSGLLMCGCITNHRATRLMQECRVMSKLSVKVEMTDAAGDPLQDVTFNQYFKDPAKMLPVQENMLAKVFGSVAEVSLEQRKAEQGV